MMGNYHVRFLGGKGVVTPLTYPVFRRENMLELFAKPILDVISTFIKNAGTKAKYKRSARAAVRLHWLLSKLAQRSETFI